jgi:hypothetical protein
MMDRDTTSAPPPPPEDTRVEAPRLPRLPKRPHTRGDCVDGPRPCPWVSCSEHLLHGRLQRSSSGRDSDLPDAVTGQPRVAGDALSDDDCIAWLEATPHTCVLDIADAGGASLDAVGQLFGVTRERVRQIERKAQQLLRPTSRARSLATYLEPDTDTRDPDADNGPPRSRGKHTRARPVDDTQRALTPPPATWTGPTHPDQVGDAGDTFWCAPLGAAMRVTLCCARQVAIYDGSNRNSARVMQHPRYPSCAECPEGNAMRTRLAVVPDASPARPNVRRLPLVDQIAAPPALPAPVETPAAIAADPPMHIEEEPMHTDTESNNVTMATVESDGAVESPAADRCAVTGCTRVVSRVRADTHKSLRRCCRECRRRGVDMMRRGSAKPNTVVDLLGETFWRTEAGSSMAIPPAPAARSARTAPAVPAARATTPTALPPAPAPALLVELRDARRALDLARRVGGVDALEAIVNELVSLRG